MIDRVTSIVNRRSSGTWVGQIVSSKRSGSENGSHSGEGEEWL